MKTRLAALLPCFSLLTMSLLPAAEGARQKVILDTDLAGDIDDAFALALILTSPEFELLGVTVGHGMTAKRAQVACRMLYETGSSGVPVAAGRATPNVAGADGKPAVYNAQLHWGEGFDRLKPIAVPSADFIIQTLRKYPRDAPGSGTRPDRRQPRL